MQGLSGGPLMPPSQTLLLRIFPKEKAAAAIALWAMTTLVAPVIGPFLGGWLCDNYALRLISREGLDMGTQHDTGRRPGGIVVQRLTGSED
jgi:MFS family permease